MFVCVCVCVHVFTYVHMYKYMHVHIYACMHVYIYTYIYMYIYVYTYPPDPISHVCSLTGKYISRKHFTYRPVQIFEIMFRRFLFSESDPPHKIMRYWFYYSSWLGFSFPQDHAGLFEMICTTVVPVLKGHLGGASPSIFLHDS